MKDRQDKWPGRGCGSLVVSTVLILSIAPSRADVTVDFDDPALALGPESYWRGPDPFGTIEDGPYGPEVIGRFTSRGTSFVNRYNLMFESWSGFAYSNTSDITTPGYTNQFSAITGTGHGAGADNYGVAYGYLNVDPSFLNEDPFDPANPAHLYALPYVTLPEGYQLDGMYVTNTTYAAMSMRYGDSFAKKFGGVSGNDPDYFLLSAYGLDAAGQPLSVSVQFYLADYRFADNRLDYIVDVWTYLDLTPLSGARSVHFNLSSSDVGEFGMNTPAYFALDDLKLRLVPEPSSLVALGLGVIVWSRLHSRRRRSA